MTYEDLKRRAIRQAIWIALRFAIPFWVGMVIPTLFVYHSGVATPIWWWAQLGIFVIGLLVGCLVSWMKHRDLFKEIREFEREAKP